MKPINKCLLSIGLIFISSDVFSQSSLFSDSNENYLDKKINDTLSDVAITEKIRTTLQRTPNINSESLAIRTEIGHVIVTGFINSEEEILIIQTIKQINHVKSVDLNVNRKE
ncbi:BON domain-containing protein [Proteus mirabilis]|uniref:BON domain-containing protein n=1 Tax=Proteus mirabilis TaxID=584 RepID=UPI000CE007CA|nr:BON domain-containing protein [Proteus mirabilis]AVB30041.1 phospholipid-binding protein [Proteus mirabilis]EMF0797248.1 BON domain-containing protein [Proteus mirabilis]QES77294.1 BON domain-containing protein [Proteus mirabilis]QKG40798.1 BON domain-containing protein [Proteus mirabilis]UZE62383.1 BON domain-containing protein [Proteus mirabilis]